MERNPKNPKCHLCGASMIGYSYKGGINWGCSNSPQCSGTIRSDKNAKIQTKKSNKTQQVQKNTK